MSLPNHQLDPQDDRCFACTMATFRKALYDAMPEDMPHKRAVGYSEDWSAEAKDDIWQSGQPWRACEEHRNTKSG